MDLRKLPDGLTPFERVEERQRRLEKMLKIDLSNLAMNDPQVGHADERNCEQMFGAVPLPVGYAGPLNVTFSNKKAHAIHLPLATTEAALVASVNRGCKAIESVKTNSVCHGISRSIAFRGARSQEPGARHEIKRTESKWKAIGESTSSHLKILNYDIDESGDFLFLTLNAETDHAMGMNMITISAQTIGHYLAEKLGIEFITVAGNVDSDKKPSQRTHDKGRGYEVIAEAVLSPEIITETLKTTPDAMLLAADAKLNHGSKLAGAIGSNLHAANVIAALYLATGQDAAHTVEGSLADTEVTKMNDDLYIRTRLPAVLVGVRGGGTELPAQKQCLDLLVKGGQSPMGTVPPLHPCKKLAESIGAAVLAGEVSLLAAQSAHDLAKAHTILARPSCG